MQRLQVVYVPSIVPVPDAYMRQIHEFLSRTFNGSVISARAVVLVDMYDTRLFDAANVATLPFLPVADAFFLREFGTRVHEMMRAEKQGLQQQLNEALEKIKRLEHEIARLRSYKFALVGQDDDGWNQIQRDLQRARTFA